MTNTPLKMEFFYRDMIETNNIPTPSNGIVVNVTSNGIDRLCDWLQQCAKLGIEGEYKEEDDRVVIYFDTESDWIAAQLIK